MDYKQKLLERNVSQKFVVEENILVKMSFYSATFTCVWKIL